MLTMIGKVTKKVIEAVVLALMAAIRREPPMQGHIKHLKGVTVLIPHMTVVIITTERTVILNKTIKTTQTLPHFLVVIRREVVAPMLHKRSKWRTL